MWHSLMLAPFVFAVACVPLMLPFGANLEYEYATATGWLMLFLVPVLALLLPKGLVISGFSSRAGTSPTSWWRGRRSRDVLWMFVGLPIFLVLPGMVLFAQGRCRCSGNGFVFWMLVQAMPAAWLAMGLHWLVLRIRFEERRVFLRLLAVSVAVGTFLLLAVAAMWLAPQKRVVHMLFGFLHGPIYDEWIPVDGGVILARLSHGLFGCLLAWVAWSTTKKTWRDYRSVLAATLVTASIWYAALAYPSAGLGLPALTQKLPREIQKEFIVMHYEPGDDNLEREMRVLLGEATFHAKDLVKVLGVATPRIVHIFVYPNDDTKKSYFGGGATDVTDVWTPSIHITREGSPHPTLRHELVHAIASQFGWHGVGFHPNMLITEGLAVALSPLEQRRDLDEASAAILKSGRVKNIETLFSPWGFWSQSGGRSYTLAGSFLNYLLQEAGSEVVRGLYAGAKIDDVTAASMGEWVRRWREHVDAKYDPTRSIEDEAMFRSPGLLRDLCPHTRADYLRPRAENIWLRLRQPPGWDPDDWTAWRAQLAPKDIAARVELWRERIKRMASERVTKDGAIATWIETVHKRRKQPPATIEDLELMVLESDLLALANKRDDSIKLLKELEQIIRQRPPGELFERQVLARIRVEQALSDSLRSREWRRYLAGWRTVPEIEVDDPWILQYLRMRRERSPNRETVMAHALTPIDEMDSGFRLEWLRINAGRLLGFEDYDNATRLYHELVRNTTGGRKVFYELQVRMTETLDRERQL